MLGALWVHAQDAAEECRAFVTQTLTEAAVVCGEVGANTACAAAGGVQAGDEALDMGDTADLNDVASLSTAAYDSEQYGVALLHTHANVPLAASPTGLVLVLMGDATLENQVTDAFLPVQPVPITTVVRANLRALPNTDGRVLAAVDVGVELQADGRSQDGAWVRVTTPDSIAGWVSTQLIDGEVSELPTITNTTRTPMQSFTLRTGTTTTCGEPSALLVQAPDGVSAGFWVNGEEIRNGETIVLTVNAENELVLYVLSGTALVDGVGVPTGFTMRVPLNEDGLVGDNRWTGLRAIDDVDREFLGLYTVFPAGWTYSAVSVPTSEEIAAIIAERNAASISNASPSLVSGVDCGAFRPTSPLGGMGLGTLTFYWDGASGADNYRINVYNEQGAVVYTADTNSGNTNLNADSTAFGGGSGFAWEVTALRGGQVACTTARASVLRDATGSGGGSTGGGGGWSP
jgi:hypothetical protein